MGRGDFGDTKSWEACVDEVPPESAVLDPSALIVGWPVGKLR